MNVTIPAWALCPKPQFFLVFSLEFVKREFQCRSRVEFSRGDRRVSHHALDRVSLLQESTDFPQYPHLSQRVVVPVSRSLSGTIRVHLLRRNHPPALGDKHPARQAEFSEVIQLDPDRITIQTTPPGIPAFSGMPRLDVKRHQLEHLPATPDHHVCRSPHVRASQKNS